eukprot:1141692-Pelagomonas_calceolata.AAC.6
MNLHACLELPNACYCLTGWAGAGGRPAAAYPGSPAECNRVGLGQLHERHGVQPDHGQGRLPDHGHNCLLCIAHVHPAGSFAACFPGQA